MTSYLNENYHFISPNEMFLFEYSKSLLICTKLVTSNQEWEFLRGDF